MSPPHRPRKVSVVTAHPGRKHSRMPRLIVVAAALAAAVALILYLSSPPSVPPTTGSTSPRQAGSDTLVTWGKRALAVSAQFHRVYTPCWEGAYGALGDAYLFRATGDSGLYRFHVIEHDLRQMCEGTWVDDRAWICLAELAWWEITEKKNVGLLLDAVRRYQEARDQGRLARSEGFWAWYNWSPQARTNEPLFTNSNMNQMITVACRLYQATGDRRFLDDALLAWNGDGSTPGVERRWYRGNGRWSGRSGKAAFGKELPWEGTGFCSVTAALYEATGEERFRDIAVATARRILDPATGWVDPVDYYQRTMDGNGAFVHFLFDAYRIAPGELKEVPEKVERMLEHVWSNHRGGATVVLHRQSDHGIRNGWNPFGGEDGYGVGEVGTVHAQGEAARAFGVFAYLHQQLANSGSARVGFILSAQ